MEMKNNLEKEKNNILMIEKNESNGSFTNDELTK